LWASCLCVALGIVPVSDRVTAQSQTGIQLASVSDQLLSADFYWSPDSKLLLFDASSGPKPDDTVHIGYDVNTQSSIQTALNQLPPSAAALNASEITEFSPFLDPTSKQPIVFLSPDQKYAVYTSSVGKLDAGEQ